jgi:inorganic triphosphatase YgiF
MVLDSVDVLAAEGEDTVGRFFEAEVEDRGMGPDRLLSAGQDLLAEHGLLPSAMSKFERGLAVLGLLARARGEEAAYELKITREDRLIDAAYRVFRKHFERMKLNEPGTRIGDDPEFLHDMRVSTRRLRMAFRTFRDAF